MEERQKMTVKELCAQLLLSRTMPCLEIRDKDLSDLNLSGLDMSNAIFSGVDFSGANFDYTTLNNTRFINCILNDCYFSYTQGTWPRFIDCQMRNSIFAHADLPRSSFIRSLLTYARFSSSNLKDAEFFRCIIQDANFESCWFHLVNVFSCTGTPRLMCPQACPDSGSFIGWKKAIEEDSIHGKAIVVKLRIPATAKRSSAEGRKCRASAAKVIGFYTLDGKKYEPKYQVRSYHDREFVYTIGKTVMPKDKFNENRWEECASGIHFFITFDEAAQYRI